MHATVLTYAVASLIVVAPTLAPVLAQDSAAAVPVATQPAAVRSPSVGSDTIRFGGRTIEAGDTVAGPVVVTAGDLLVRGVIRGTAITIAGDILVEAGGTITGDAIAVLGGVTLQQGTVGGTAGRYTVSFPWRLPRGAIRLTP